MPRLPPGLAPHAATDNRANVSNVSRAYRVNLNVLALVALLTGAFLVFATQLTAVAQRSTQFALLGVLGLQPRMRLLQVLLEGLAIGIPGRCSACCWVTRRQLREPGGEPVGGTWASDGGAIMAIPPSANFFVY